MKDDKKKIIHATPIIENGSNRLGKIENCALTLVTNSQNRHDITLN